MEIYRKKVLNHNHISETKKWYRFKMGGGGKKIQFLFPEDTHVTKIWKSTSQKDIFKEIWVKFGRSLIASIFKTIYLFFIVYLNCICKAET